MSWRLLIVSCGALGREIWHAAQLAATQPGIGDSVSVAGFLDDRPGAGDDPRLADMPVLGSPWDYPLSAGDRLLVAIGDPQERARFTQRLAMRQASFATLITPGCRITTARSCIGPGSFFDHYALVSCDVVIGAHTYIGSHATIGHDTRIGDHCQIGAFVFIGGNVSIGARVTIRSHASISHGVVIEDDAVVGPNTAVLRRVRQGDTVFGVPATSVKFK